MLVRNLMSSKLFKSTGIYTISSIINKAIPFFLLPLMTRFLTPEDYGIVSMFGVVLSITIPIIGLSVDGAVERVYFEKDSVKIEEYIFNTLILLLISSILGAFLYILLVKYITDITSIPKNILWTVVIIAIFEFISRIVLVIFRVQYKAKQFGIFQISSTALNTIASILLIVYFGLTWEGRILAQLLAALLMGTIGLFVLIRGKWIKARINFSYLIHAFRFGIPLVPHAIGSVIMTITDRLFITNMVGLETTGIYSVGYQIGMIINILSVSFNQAYAPWLYSKLKENNFSNKLKIVKGTYIYFASILMVALILSVIAPLIVTIFVGDKFEGSVIYVFWISVGYAFNGMYFMVTNYIFFAERTSILAKITFTSALFNIPLNYYFVSSYGAIGAAQATTIIYLIKFLLTWMLSSKVFKMPWNLKQIGN